MGRLASIPLDRAKPAPVGTASFFDSLIQIETDDFSAFTPGPRRELGTDRRHHLAIHPAPGRDFPQWTALRRSRCEGIDRAGHRATVEETTTASRFVPTTVEIIDDFTVQLKTETPFAPMLNELARLAILSADDIQPSMTPQRPRPGSIRSRAFRMERDPSGWSTISRMSKRWRPTPTTGRRAGNRHLVWEYIQDGQTRLNAFLAGQAQAIDRVPPSTSR